MAHLEAPCQGGLRATARAGELRRWRADCDDIMRGILWSDWFGRSLAAQLAFALARAENASGVPTAIERCLPNVSQRPFLRLVDAAVRRGFQREVRQIVRTDPVLHMGALMQDRMIRWELPGNPRTYAGRVEAMLQVLSPLVPPRVRAAVLRTLWNGWITARRGPAGPIAFLGALAPRIRSSITVHTGRWRASHDDDSVCAQRRLQRPERTASS
ncbi:unnamed protein product [Prorocentrum cordatum]|uniref:Uncharacterized protein n=1 Tax=Prorocentrum cordatum TaxID=2364126 RepID=A0ABN9WMI1_9DINO|nr:unnamed protein product [Polarella glacialis]